jgi:thioesterase domain-containing protein
MRLRYILAIRVQNGAQRQMESTTAGSARELERYLHERIPLSRTMQVSCIAADPEGVILHAPLAPNINHHATVFGGSASALAILAAWSLLHLRLQHVHSDCDLVIQRNTMDYLLPITGAFTATAALLEPQEWPRILRLLERRGLARARVGAHLRLGDQVSGRFSGEFVAMTRGNQGP